MPRKNDINSTYHSKNDRAKGTSKMKGSMHDYFEEIPLSPDWAMENGRSVFDILKTGQIQDERDYWIYSVMNSIPGLSGYLQGIGQLEDLKSYMDKHDLKWTDLKPWRIANVGAQKMYRDSVNYIGDMVKLLYS